MRIGRSSQITSLLRVVFVLFLTLMSFAVVVPANAFPITHTVTFTENANVVDSVTSFQTGSSSQSLTLLQNLTPSFSDAGYDFVGWNTSPDGSGVSYADGSVYLFNADIILYGQWSAIPVFHTVTFNENDNVSDSINTYIVESSPTDLTSFGSLQPTFADAGYTFSGWNTSANGSGVSYADGIQYSFASDLNLYAQWTLQAVVPVFHTVTFNENDSNTDSVTSSMSASKVTPLVLFTSLVPAFSNSARTFTDWNTSSDGSGVSYLNGAQFAFTSNLTLYAQWAISVVDTFTFNANGGSGTVASISGSPGSTLTIPNQSGIIRAGYVLTDWNTKADGTGTKYLLDETVTFSESTVLYAQWSGHKLSTLFGAIGTFKAGSSKLSASLKSQINRVAVTIRTRKYLEIDLFGYTAATGLRSINVALSRARAHNVAVYLRNRLIALKDRGVRISSTGEGAITGQSSNAYSRVEVFGV